MANFLQNLYIDYKLYKKQTSNLVIRRESESRILSGDLSRINFWQNHTYIERNLIKRSKIVQNSPEKCMYYFLGNTLGIEIVRHLTSSLLPFSGQNFFYFANLSLLLSSTFQII